MIHWVCLILAIVFEGAGTIMMKVSNGGEHLLPTILVGVFYIICFSLFVVALKGIPLSIAYAIWSGIGVVIAVTAGLFLFNETLSGLKVFAIVLIVGGVALLNYVSN